jgi:hypothetical protein
MKVNVEIKAEMLKVLMSEDRKEIRGIRASIYNILSLLAGLSFVASPFLTDKFRSLPRSIIPITDGVIIILIWVIYNRLKADLYCCRQCLEGREKLIKNLDETDTSDLDPFPDFSKEEPKITDSELLLLPRVATTLIALKSLLITILYHGISPYP